MLRHLFSSLLMGCGLLAAGPSGAFVVSPPAEPQASNATTTSQTDQQFQLGYDLGYEQGFGRGLAAGVAECVADPRGCGIALSDANTPAGEYGETEPNDNMSTADLLVEGHPFRGQTYGQQDEDWFKITVPSDNRALTVNFALADIAAGNLTGWTLSIRNDRGMTFAEVETGFMAVADTLDGMDYKLTLGRSGVYFIIVKPLLNELNRQQYRLTASLNSTPTIPDDGTPVGFYDVETEPNNVPYDVNHPNQDADELSLGTTMYGLVNLEFSHPIPGDPTYTWGQGEDDWFVFESLGNEIAQISFCDRQVCSAGNWLVQLFDDRVELMSSDPCDPLEPCEPCNPSTEPCNPFPAPENGADPYDAAALVSFNTTNCGLEPCDTGRVCPGPCDPRAAPEVWHMGIEEPGTYYLRVNHKRLLAAPCAGYTFDENNDRFICDPEKYPQECRGDAAEEKPCGCDSGYSCEIDIRNPSPNFDPICVDNDTPNCALCPDGSGGGDETQCTVGCICTSFGGVVSLPSSDADTDLYTSQYNFTLTTNPFGSSSQ